MSYCRMGPDSDAYLIRTFGGGWSCYSCRINRGETKRILRRKEVLDHFLAHKKAGDKIPAYAIARIRKEIKP